MKKYIKRRLPVAQTKDDKGNTKYYFLSKDYKTVLLHFKEDPNTLSEIKTSELYSFSSLDANITAAAMDKYPVAVVAGNTPANNMDPNFGTYDPAEEAPVEETYVEEEPVEEAPVEETYVEEEPVEEAPVEETYVEEEPVEEAPVEETYVEEAPVEEAA